MSGTSSNTTSVNLTTLDFSTYKQSLKTYLQSQSQFSDYDFDGSNLSVLLDILSYNTYMAAYYKNMVATEMFLDTAQLRDNAVLRAKELNYLPGSFRSAQALVNLVITPPSNQTSNAVLMSIPSGTTFTSKSGSNTYTFQTQQNYVIPANTDGNYYAQNVAIFEGTSVNDTFIIQPQSNTDLNYFTLSNPTIDISSLTVVSVENNGANVIPYTYAPNLLNLTSNSAVYFLQGAENNQYQLLFGDNVIGRRPADYSVIVANYLVTNGQLPNGLTTFIPNGTIGGYSNVAVTTIKSAQGGDISESIASIKYKAPRYYAAQSRCVTENDYETILISQFPEIQAISVYGGQDLTPPQYGQVYISLKIYNSDLIPQTNINSYQQFLSSVGMINIINNFVEPNYLYASVSTTVKYNINVTTLQPNDISALVTSAIQTYNQTQLQNFKSTLLYSTLTNAIENSHTSIISNQTTYRLMRKLIPNIASGNYIIPFNQALYVSGAIPTSYSTTVKTAIQSTVFTYNGVVCNLADDGNGNIRIVQNDSKGMFTTVIANIGSINYATGVVQLNNFVVNSYIGDSIRIYANLPNGVFDSASIQNDIFEIPNDEITVNVVQVSQ